MSTIASRIKELRLSKHMTQAEFGNIFGIVKSTISLYESGKSTPNDQIKTKICEYFNVSMDYLHGLSDETEPYSSNNRIDKPSESALLSPQIAYWISKSGIGYNEIAQELKIEENELEDYCSGETPIPLPALMKISEICNVSTDCLLGLRDKSRRKNPNGEIPFRLDAEISRRLKEQAIAMDESYGQIAAMLGIEETEVFNFFEYGFVPHITIFAKIVEHFLVSSDYLLNRSNSTLTIQGDENELLRSYRALNPKSKTMALSRIYELEREESLVAAKDRYLDKEGKSLPSSGTGGGTMVG